MARLHKFDGSFVGLSRIPFAILSTYQAVLRKTLGIYPALPWIPFSAISHLNRIIKKDWHVLEFGSGMSTPWLAARSKHVISYEADKFWYERLNHILESRKINNVKLIYEFRGHIMSRYDSIADKSLDLLYIDGGPRGDCLINGYDKVKDGGYLYLDNWDSGHFWQNHLGDAKEFLHSKSKEHTVTYFDDYVPSMPTIQQSILVKKNSG